jgi:bifunctional UDP-N-acetylglucosamine pyrophosphorylase/glucosamine-1-phosphate N-acetyltransferase
MKTNVTVVILAAGLGTRMKSGKAKVLHRAGGDTLLNHVIRAALHIAAPEQIVAIVGHQADEVRQSVKVPGVRFALQSDQKGTGHAVSCARDLAAESPGLLVILNGDGPLLKPATLEGFLALADSSSLAGAVMAAELPDPTGYGRLLLDSSGNLAAIVEEKAADAAQRAIRKANTGQYWFRAPVFWEHVDELQPSNPAREFYITDMVEILRRHGHALGSFLVADHTELLGINTRLELSVADRILRQRKLEELMLSGVTIERPETVTIDVDVEVGHDTLIEPHVSLRGSTRVGTQCRIGAGAVLSDCEIADQVHILPYVVAELAKIGAACDVGPFARLRKDAVLSEHCHIGNFVELKNTKMHRGAKASHLAYLGDASIGEATNVGAGTITCNYDGFHKHRTEIGDRVFVGSNSTLVAPLTIASGAYIAAGSVITENVAEDALALGRARQVDKPGWAKRRRDRQKKAEPVT